MKKVGIILLSSCWLLVSALLLCSCAGTAKTDGTTITPEKTGEAPPSSDMSSLAHYDLIRYNSNDCRLVLKAEAQAADNVDPAEQEEAELEFSSVDELIQTIVEDQFEAWQLEVIRESFRSDEKGVIIFDLNNPKRAKMPEGFSVDGVYWRGANYSFSLQNAQNELAFIHWLTDDEFRSQFDGSYTNFFEKDTVELISHVQNDGFDEYIFKTSVATLKKIRYKLDDNTCVDETYRLESSVSSMETSDSVPYEITLYHRESGSNYIADLFHPVARYESDYMLQFGI